MSDAPDAYFVRLGPGRFRATEHTGGGWSTREQHIAPMAGLVVHEVEQDAAARGLAAGMAVGRLSLEILGVIGLDEFTVDVAVVRPGRTIELVEATVGWAGRVVVRARVWRMATGDTAAVVGGEHEPMPAPHDVPLWDMTGRWPGGFVASLEVRRGADARPGRARAWVSSDLDLVAGEQTSALARFVAVVDAANGIAVREDPTAWLFPNLDLTVHLHRHPEPGPTGLDITVDFGPAGLGLTSSVLHDLHGPVGQVAQTLTLRRAPAAPPGPPAPARP